jgi:hypothetical protein
VRKLSKKEDRHWGTSRLLDAGAIHLECWGGKQGQGKSWLAFENANLRGVELQESWGYSNGCRGILRV